MKQKLLNFFILFCLFTGISGSAFSQGTTSAGINGMVTDAGGEELPGANVIAVHQPSGTRYGAVTNARGRFNLPNVRIGGPYAVTVSYVGFEENVTSGIQLSLGQTYSMEIRLTETGMELEGVEVIGRRDPVMNSERTGAATTISEEQIETLPTISRSFSDFVRATPQADIKGGAISIGGMNNRFNQITIDGAVSNDVFGLSGTGTNGGETGTSPISLDAIQAFEVQIAPYDVRLGGFAGGGISAVTRSGTNNVNGSVYYFFRNEKLAGKTPGSLIPENDPEFERTRFDEFSDQQYGIRVGGPIVKDKLFFFVNAEQTNNVTPLSFQPGSSESNISLEAAARAAARAEEFGYNPGSFTDQETSRSSDKLFGRLDWNINDMHKLTLRHSYTRGDFLELSRDPNTLTFSNGGVLRESTTNSTVLDFSSRISNEMSNNLIVNYTTVREPRGAPGDPFPRVTIDLGSRRSIRLGTEAYSTVNNLEQDVLTITDNFSLFKGRHHITIGTHNEFYNMYNAFIGQAYGDYVFNSIEDWEAGLANSYTYQYSRTPNPEEGAEFSAMQLGLYVQDEFQMTNNFMLAYGLRLDVPIYTDSPLRNDDFNNSVLGESLIGQRNDELPKPAFMFSPRVGFNWDVNGDRSTQVRGGTGLFTSRFPFVWVGGAFTQSGILLDRNNASVQEGDPANIPFNPDPFNQTKRAQASGPGGNITVVDRNFKLPQIFRTNLAVDQLLPGGFIATLEGMYSKNYNAFRFTNLNLVEPTATLGGADNRPLYPASLSDRTILDNYSEVIFVENVNEGFAYNLTAQLQKNFQNGFYSSLAYTYTRSEDLFAGTSSQNQSNFYRVPTVRGSNNVEVGFSPFDVRSRIVGMVSYRKEYLNHLATTVSLFYNGQSGTPFSYVYNRDLNRESNRLNESYDLIYVPANASEILFKEGEGRTAAQQWDDLNAFIEADDYLSTRRGQYAERNAARTPFTHQFDIKILQDIFTNIGGKRNTLQLSLDIFNVGNLLNKDWGRQYDWGFGSSYFDNTFRLLRLEEYTANNTPVFSFDPVRNNEPYNTNDAPIGGSRWVGQIGIRYIFE